MEFSGVRPPNSRMVTAESVGLLKRFESEQVPKNFLPLALNALSRPVAAGEPGLVVVVVGPGGGFDVGPGAEPGWHCEYQSLSLTHVVPASQVVPPVQPWPWITTLK